MSNQPPSPGADSDQLLYEILRAIADERGEDVTSLSPVGDLVDLDALVSFLGTSTVPATVNMDLYDCHVEIGADGSVTVTAGTDGG